MAAASNEESTRKVLQTLAGEVFHFFSFNVKVWREKPDCLPFYDCSVGGNYSCLRSSTKKAVVTFSYLFRHEWEKKFLSFSEKLKNAEDYETLVLGCRTCKHKMNMRNYMCYFLASIAFLLEITRFCFVEGHDYSKEGKRCLVKYADITFFEKVDAWDNFYAASEVIGVFHDRLTASFCGIFPESDITAPFFKALYDISRFDKYEQNLKEFTMHRNFGRSISPLPQKLMDLLIFKPDTIRFGYLVIRKNLDISKEKVSSPKSGSSTAQTPTESDDRRDDIISDLSSDMKNLTVTDNRVASHAEDDSWKTESELRIESATDASNVLSKVNIQSEQTEFDSTNSVFIMTEKCLKKRYKKKGRKPKRKIGVKVYLPSKQRTEVVEKLDEILEDNVHKDNVSPLSSKTIAVGPPSWRERCDDCRLILVNSSSEEEDDEFDPVQCSIMLQVTQQWRKYDIPRILIVMHLLRNRIWEVNPGSSLSLSNVPDPPPRNRYNLGRKSEWVKNSL